MIRQPGGGSPRATWSTPPAARGELAELAGDRSFGSAAQGQLYVIDPAAAPTIDTILLPTPTPHSKGILIAPAAHGNLLLGPTAEDGDDPNDWTTSASGWRRYGRARGGWLPSLDVRQRSRSTPGCARWAAR